MGGNFGLATPVSFTTLTAMPYAVVKDQKASLEKDYSDSTVGSILNILSQSLCCR